MQSSSEWTSQWTSEWTAREWWICLTPRPTYARCSQLSKGAEFVVAPDSSVTHMAAGLDTACVSLWGSVTIQLTVVSIILNRSRSSNPILARTRLADRMEACRRLSVRTQPTAPRKRRCGAMLYAISQPKDIVEAAKKVVTL
jgi:hypothetical protein